MGFWSSLTKAVIALLFSKNVCYHEDGIGCFSNKKPFDNAYGKVPESPGSQQIQFLLYTRQNPTSPQTITRQHASIKASNYKGYKDTKIIIHGYREFAQKPSFMAMKDAMLKKENVNVIVVNWQKGADDADYRQAAANTRVVGAMVANLMISLHTTSGQGSKTGNVTGSMIANLLKTIGGTYGGMHLIGFSLGAHVAGYAGDRIRGTGRITGLDPAGPLFEDEDPVVRLDKSDAEFVDVIHTDAESIKDLGFGTPKQLGHADFYPNGGKNQPGCPHNVGDQFLRFFSGKFDLAGNIGCNHKRAKTYFIESITSSCKFTSYPCSSYDDFKANKCTCGSGCASMGYKASKARQGKFYLRTYSTSPHCRTK